MADVIDIKNLSKSYGTLKALDNITLSVGENELFGLIGPDGAGKTTLYSILSTLRTPDSGTATVLGYDTVRDYRQIRRNIGYMPEQFSLYQDLTVKENLEFFASIFNVKVSDNYDLIAPIFGQLERFPNRRAGALSGGMKQKLALSCALIHRPKLLLLDEPTTGVDAVSRSEFWEMLDGLRKQDISIMVSTSYMDEAEMCGRIALIADGHILRTDTPDNLVTEMGNKLWNASADNMTALLSALRNEANVRECYTFGATLHVVAGPEFDPDAIQGRLLEQGLTNVRIYPAHPTIEDLFIKLASHDNQEPLP